MPKNKITRGSLNYNLAPDAITPYTFKGMLAHIALALNRVAAAMESMAMAIEKNKEKD